MTRPFRRVAPLLAAVLALALGACSTAGTRTPGKTTGPGATTSSAAAPATRPYAGTEFSRTYVDHTRPTVDPNGTNSAPVRTLVTVVRVPHGPGPFPLVVFAHGNNGHPRKVTQLLDAWARAGYVVAAPAFPLTNDDVNPTVIGDYVQQPADLEVVINGVLADARKHSGPLAGKIDPHRIGIAGHSLGGATVYGLAANTCCRDERVAAVIALSAIRLDFPRGSFEAVKVPLLAMHGTADPTIPYAAGRAAYDEWAGPKWFLTLQGALHSPQYEDPPSPYDALVLDITTLFWDVELRRDPHAVSRLASYVPPSALGRLESAG
jgi:predicted dienelactone hydrolase